MGRLRISYFDVVGRALAGASDDRQVGRAIQRLSATYRSGKANLDYASDVGRAAYLWHILPAHICDLARLLEDNLDLLEGRERIELLGLGAGPGSEALALLEVVSRAQARGDLPALTALSCRRVERVRDWDASFAALVEEAHAQVGQRSEGFSLEAPREAMICDLTVADPPEDVLAAVRRADLIVAANLVSEIPPRGTDALPEGFRLACQRLLTAGGPTEILIVDRAGAPGVPGRLAELVELAREVDPGVQVTGPRERSTRCGCALTRKARSIYRHVQLPTTRHEDRPVRNCKTLWCRLTLQRQATIEP